MFERMTDAARQVVVLSQEEARLLDHDAIGTEHLLLALLASREGVASRALPQSISLKAAREQVEALFGRGGRARVGNIPFAPKGKKALELTLREAQEAGHDRTTTGHLLLGLLGDEQSRACAVLRELGADLAAVREQAAALAGEEGPPSGVRSWGGPEPMSERLARARARAEAERDPVRERDPGSWDVLAHAGTGMLRALAAARRHVAHGLRHEVEPVDLVVGVLAVRDPTVREALAQAGAQDPSPGRLFPGYREDETGDDVLVALSQDTRRACSMAVRLVPEDGACITPAHLLLAALEVLGPARAAAAAERLGAEEGALRPALLGRTVAGPNGAEADPAGEGGGSSEPRAG